MNAPRHVRGEFARSRLPDVRPLDRLSSIKIKLGVLVAATVTAAAFITWLGLYNHLGPSRTLPIAIVGSLIVTQLLARGMTSPLREMTYAARRMAAGDYSRRVRATSLDEVGQLADAFNTMADDLEQADVFRRELIANVSHELRTPVTALQAQLENIVDGVTEADPATMQAALAQTERLGRLVTYLLDLSRLEAGDVPLEIADVRLQDFLEEAAEGAMLVGATKRLTLPRRRRAVGPHRPGRPGPAAPGRREPPAQRGAALPRRRRGAARGAAGGYGRAHRRGRPRPGHLARAAPARVRAVRARQQPGGHRSGLDGRHRAWAWRSSGGRSSCTAGGSRSRTPRSAARCA